MNSHAVEVGGEISDLCSEDEVSPLGIRQEDDEEHDCETSNILGATSQSGLKLGHGLVKADVFEDLEKSV